MSEINVDELLAQQEDQDFRAATLGVEVEAFLASPTGQYLIQRAEDEIDALRHRLEEIDPFDGAAVARTQNAIWVRKMIGLWLQQAVHEALRAEDRIRDEESLTH